MPYCAGRRLHTRPKGVITYQSFGLDKKLSNPIGVLNFLEAPPGFGPGIRVLQTRALPLGHGAIFRMPYYYSKEGELCQGVFKKRKKFLRRDRYLLWNRALTCRDRRPRQPAIRDRHPKNAQTRRGRRPRRPVFGNLQSKSTVFNRRENFNYSP